MCGWVIYFLKGATYEATITIDGVADIANATEWRVRCVDERQNVILTASSVGASPMLVLVPNTDGKSMRMTVPATTTSAMVVQSGYYDLEVLWTNGVVRRYISRGSVEVVQKAGA
jgi:hypothetical protein